MRLRLSLFWFFYFAALGIFFPYFALYLRENCALNGAQMGAVQAVFPLVGILAQPFWGQVADRSGARAQLLAFLTLVAAAGFSAIAWAQGFTQMLLVTAVWSLFATAVVPLGVSVNMAALGPAAAQLFGYVRVWGTVSFLLAVAGFPVLLHAVQAARGLARGGGPVSEPGLELMFPVAGVLALLGAVSAWYLPRSGGVALRAERGDWRLLLRNRDVQRLLAFTLGAYLFTQGPMAIFPVYVRSLGGDLDMVGKMWVFMLALEIPLVAFSGPGFRRLGGRALLGIGTAAGGLRWIACALSDDLRVIYPVQLLHGVVVAGMMIGGSLHLDTVVPERLRSTAQALLATIGVGIGGILSNIATGLLLDSTGIVVPYLAGGCGALLLGLSVPWVLRKN